MPWTTFAMQISHGRSVDEVVGETGTYLLNQEV